MISLGAIEGRPGEWTKDVRHWVYTLAEIADYYPALELVGEDVSFKPEDWSELGKEADELSPADLAEVKGAQLADRDLKYATAVGAFFLKANLPEADLRGTNPPGGQPPGGRPQGRQPPGGLPQGRQPQGVLPRPPGGWRRRGRTPGGFQKADLKHANLQGADLRFASLQKADLQGANLQESYLFGANLQEADLRVANLRGGRFWRP